MPPTDIHDQFRQACADPESAEGSLMAVLMKAHEAFSLQDWADFVSIVGEMWARSESENKQRLGKSMVADPLDLGLWGALIQWWSQGAQPIASIFAQQLYRRVPTEIDYLMILLDLCMKSGEYARAQEMILDRQPWIAGNDALLFRLGICQIMQKQLGEAAQTACLFTEFKRTQPAYFKHQLTEMLTRAELLAVELERHDPRAWFWVWTAGFLLFPEASQPHVVTALDDFAMGQAILGIEQAFEILQVKIPYIQYPKFVGDRDFASALAVRMDNESIEWRIGGDGGLLVCTQARSSGPLFQFDAASQPKTIRLCLQLSRKKFFEYNFGLTVFVGELGAQHRSFNSANVAAHDGRAAQAELLEACRILEEENQVWGLDASSLFLEKMRHHNIGLNSQMLNRPLWPLTFL